jgi:hypothetical protein
MEMSCDETVIKKLGSDIKKEYASSLLSLAAGRRMLGGTPLAFGEGDTKSRIQNVLNYKKPPFRIAVAAIVLCGALIVGLMANPDSKEIIMVDVSFPSPSENESIAGETKPFTAEFLLPNGWEVRHPDANGDRGVSYFSSNFLVEMHLYHDDVFVGQIGFNGFEPYEEEILAEDYYKTVYPVLRLGSMYTWDAYTPVNTTETFEAAIAMVSYPDETEVEKHPGAMPDVPVTEVPGVLAYDKNLRVYMGIQFTGDAVTQRQVKQIASNIRFTTAYYHDSIS